MRGLDPAPKIGRRRGRRNQCRKRRQALLPGGDRAGEACVAGDQPFRLAPLVALQRAERVFGGKQIAVRCVAHDARHPRSEIRLRRIHDFTVPSGTLSRSASSLCDSPSTNAITTRRRRSASSRPRQRCSAAPSAVLTRRASASGASSSISVGLVARHLARVAAHGVQRAIAHDADQPGLRRATVRIEAMRLLPDLHERVLRGVRRQCRLPGDPQRDPVQPVAPAIIQQPKRRTVAAGAAMQQRIGVVDIGGLHGEGHRLGVSGSTLAYTARWPKRMHVRPNDRLDDGAAPAAFRTDRTKSLFASV